MMDEAAAEPLIEKIVTGIDFTNRHLFQALPNFVTIVTKFGARKCSRVKFLAFSD